MKKRTKWILIIAGIVVCLVILFLLIALPFGNNNALLSYIGKPGDNPPPAWMLARADQSDIGESVTLSFAQILENSQYDELGSEFMESMPENVHVAYIYDPAKNTGRLIVITAVETNNTLSCLTVYEPEWVGGEGLFANLDQEFQAKIIHRVNITRAEGEYYFSQMMWQYAENDPTVKIDIPSYLDQEQQEIQSFYGSIFYTDADDAYKIQEGVGASFICCEMSRRISGMCDFMLVIERYGLAEYLGI